MDSSAIGALQSTLRVLWPDSHQVRLTGRETRTDRGARAFVVVPNARAPRLLVPAGSAAAAAGAMHRFSTALAPREVASRLMAGSVLRAGGARLMPHRIEVVGGDSTSIAQYLGDVLGTDDVLVSLGIGNERANRKPVLQVFDRRGRTLAFAKVADAAHVEQHLESEIRSLTTLSGHRIPRSIEVPRLLHAGRWNGKLVLVLTALATAPLQRPGQWSVPQQAMHDFAAAFDDGEQRLVDAPVWSWLREAERGLESVELRQRLGTALDRLGELASQEPLRIGAWHGDWTPWNMSRRGKRIRLWDWERFQTGVPVGLDERHYAVNAVCRRDGLSQATVRAGLDLADGGNRSARSRVLDAAYLAAISARYLGSAQQEMGQVIEQRAKVMLDALERNLEVR